MHIEWKIGFGYKDDKNLADSPSTKSIVSNVTKLCLLSEQPMNMYFCYLRTSYSPRKADGNYSSAVQKYELTVRLPPLRSINTVDSVSTGRLSPGITNRSSLGYSSI